MSDAEKIALLEDMFELDAGGLNAETHLHDIEDWDSMAALMLISLTDLKFGKKLGPVQIDEFVTIGDILAYWG